MENSNNKKNGTNAETRILKQQTHVYQNKMPTVKVKYKRQKENTIKEVVHNREYSINTRFGENLQKVQKNSNSQASMYTRKKSEK